MEEDIITKDINKNMLKKLDNGLLLSDAHIEILERYGFDCKKYASIEELIFDIEEFLNEEGDSDCGDLDWVSADLSERNYYQNTNK
ncbi:MAG: hypothetical protein E7158_01080 [Firmicutes bacterium]|nr:hypothetical protein [Bacillota bacterium]